MSNNYLSLLAKPYKTNAYLNLFVTPYGQATIETLKRYCMGSIFSNFDNPIFLSSPVLQNNLTKSSESIKIDPNVSLRHTFHHFYFDHLHSAQANQSQFPLEYIEQGPIFRAESEEALKPFLRQSYFTVTNLHAFCISKEQSLDEISRVFTTLRSYEKDWQLTFQVECHLKSEDTVRVTELKKLWGDEFKINNNSDEEASIAMDFSVIVEGKTFELCSLEIYKTQIGNLYVTLVDFTVGGIERILATIYLSSKKLPGWLAPITLVTSKENLPIEESLSTFQNVRIAIAPSQRDVVNLKKKYKIPFVFNGNGSLIKYIKEIEEAIPFYLSRPFHNNLWLDQHEHSYDVLKVEGK